MRKISKYDEYELMWILESYQHDDALLESKLKDYVSKLISSKGIDKAIKFISGSPAKSILLSIMLSTSLCNMTRHQVRGEMVKMDIAPVEIDMAENKMFDDYKRDAEIYLKREIFKGGSVTAEMLVNSARKAYKKHGVLVPLELVLAQGQIESHMGKAGRKHHDTNPFNVGEYDEGTVIKFKNVRDGIDAYFDLIATDYLVKGEKKLSDLLNNFVNKDGYRYAGNTKYEDTLKGLTKFIRKYIDNRKETASTSVVDKGST